MVAIKNAAPNYLLQGIKDESGRPAVIEPELIPSHLAHVFLFAERGTTLPQLVVGDSLTRMYGAKSFSYRSPFATHQTVLANLLNGRANSMMVQRVVPEDAGRPATIRLSLDLIADAIPQYERNLDLSFKVGLDGKRIATGTTVPGNRSRWLLEMIETGVELGAADARVGSMTDAQGEPSTIYPIHEFEVNDPGAYGRLLGLRLSSPTVESSNPIDDVIAAAQKAYLYRIQFVERPDAASTPNVLETLLGEQFVDFAYKEGVINTVSDSELSAREVILQGWASSASNGLPPVFGPFGKMHIYDENIELILAQLQATEAAYGLISDDAEDAHLFNFVGGYDYNAVPYYSYSVEGPELGGLLMTEASTHYALGGSDGTLSFDTFDKAVANQLANYGDLEADLLDDAVYPQSVIYDTGFTLDTKKKLFVPMGRRKDMYVVVSTQDVSTPQNTPSEESSIAIALRTAARMYPESEVFGTPVCRAIIIGHSGYLVDSAWKKLSCLTLDFADKCALYMGAGNGIWKPGFGFDMPPNNQITLFRDVNSPFKNAAARTRDWTNGLVWVQSYDRRSLFTPAYQTVYDDDTSILNAAPNMFVAVELEKVAQRVWRDLVGISKLTPEQFIERSNRLIEARTAGRFDDRVVIVAETYYTANDSQRGYSWSCNINMYGNNMKTVGSFTIVARRRGDLPA